MKKRFVFLAAIFAVAVGFGLVSCSSDSSSGDDDDDGDFFSNTTWIYHNVQGLEFGNNGKVNVVYLGETSYSVTQTSDEYVAKLSPITTTSSGSTTTRTLTLTVNKNSASSGTLLDHYVIVTSVLGRTYSTNYNETFAVTKK